jgi:hypothetical protein
MTFCMTGPDAVSEEMIARLDTALDELAARTDWKVLHLRSDAGRDRVDRDALLAKLTRGSLGEPEGHR